MTEKTYAEALRETIDACLKEDERVFIVGEDIGIYGGAFAITKGLYTKYGKERVIDSPMSEAALVGLGVGSAIQGLRPIVEIMFMDFVTLIYDQLFNHASIFSYLSDEKISVPLVVRVAAGAGRGYGATHSKTLIAPLMQIPGIKIVAPSRASEISGLFRASLADKNPVIFVEQKLLYGKRDDVSNAEDVMELGRGRVVRRGEDVSVISFSKCVIDCEEVAAELEKEGVSVEVVDLRTIKPFDMDIIKTSVEKTGKVVVVEEGFMLCGVGAEIVAQINEHCFFALDAPPIRVAMPDVPIASNSVFEQEIMPHTQKIRDAIYAVLDE